MPIQNSLFSLLSLDRLSLYMEDISSLAKELKAHLPWHQARIIFLAQFILALIKARSCNLCRVAEEFQSKAQEESSYRRIKRFFSRYTYCYEQVARLILHWLKLSQYTLCMDRTNWKFGANLSTIWWFQLHSKALRFVLSGFVWINPVATPIPVSA